jgi:putative sterol carrier protein
MNRRTSDHTEEFFERLSSTPQPLEHDVSATIQIDLDDKGDVQSWLLRIDRGRIHVSHRPSRTADATIRTDKSFFEQIVTGEANALSAALRGRMSIEGDLRLLVAFTRLLPGPPARVTTVPASNRTAKEAARTVKAAGTTVRTARVSAAAARTTRKDRGQ